MNRDELSKMLDLVDEKYLNEALGNESAESAAVSVVGTTKITALKQRSIGSGFACIAAALALVIGLTLLTNPTEISVDEGQGVFTDSETVTDIIETDVSENEPYDYGELFSSPLDLVQWDFNDYSDGEAVYYYNSDHGELLLPDRVAALMNGDFDTMATVTFDGSGKVSSANIGITSSDSDFRQFTFAMSDIPKYSGLWNGFDYAGKTERLGKTVHSCYCEKTNGLNLWAYFENEGTAFVLYSLGFERDESALILDGLITGSISLDGFTPGNADGMWQNLTVEQAAALPEFKGKVCTEKQLGDKYLHGDRIIYERQFNKEEDHFTSAFALVYADSFNMNGNVSVNYSINNDISAANTAIVDIASVTPEKIAEWCGSGENSLCINADGVYLTVRGEYSPEFLEALTAHLKADSN
ncbi:MAG: hypothetical protein K2N72_08570 [Oscillospiraceae bacterium]|nr:hypothetical protein [Oscillospiraceae bacterium]